jgi:hypothetical protein
MPNFLGRPTAERTLSNSGLAGLKSEMPHAGIRRRGYNSTDNTSCDNKNPLGRIGDVIPERGKDLETLFLQALHHLGFQLVPIKPVASGSH